MDEIRHKVGYGVLGIADDVCVATKDDESHDKVLHKLMQVAIFRKEKCSIKQSQISFYGLIWTKDSVKPDPEKCDRIHSRPAPSNTQELQSFLGLLQYMSPFIPSISSKTEILRELLRENNAFTWTPDHQKAFEDLKSSIHDQLALRHFDPKQPCTIEVDASLSGLGAALVQQGRPVAFTSKALTDAERRYANIEREMLAVVHGCERFHTFVYGKEFVAESDHKPLEQIVLKSLNQTPPRLQRMLLRLQPYDIQLRYKPGKEMIYADYLSRYSPSDGTTIELDETVHMIQISQSKLHDVRQATNEDQELSALRENKSP